MDLKEVFLKLDKMNDHISVLRENTARMSAVLEENTRDVREHMVRTDKLEQDVQRWKGIVLGISILFGAIATITQIGIQLFFK